MTDQNKEITLSDVKMSLEEAYEMKQALTEAFKHAKNQMDNYSAGKGEQAQFVRSMASIADSRIALDEHVTKMRMAVK
jgi:hypothetical protein